MSPSFILPLTIESSPEGAGLPADAEHLNQAHVSAGGSGGAL